MEELRCHSLCVSAKTLDGRQHMDDSKRFCVPQSHGGPARSLSGSKLQSLQHSLIALQNAEECMTGVSQLRPGRVLLQLSNLSVMSAVAAVA